MNKHLLKIIIWFLVIICSKPYWVNAEGIDFPLRRIRFISLEDAQRQLASLLNASDAEYIIDKLEKFPGWDKYLILNEIISWASNFKKEGLDVSGIIIPAFDALFKFATDDLTYVNYFNDSLSQVYSFIKGEIDSTLSEWWDSQIPIKEAVPQKPPYVYAVFSWIAEYSLGKPPHRFQLTDLRKEILPLRKSLLSLYEYILSLDQTDMMLRFPQLEESDFELPKYRTYVFLKITRMLPKNPEQWIDRIKNKVITLGAWIPFSIQREIFERAAKEVIFKKDKYAYYNLEDFLPLYRIGVDELMLEEIPFLKDSLSIFYRAHQGIVNFRRNLGIYDDLDNYLWIDLIRGNERVHWEEMEIPLEIIKHLLLKLVQEWNQKQSQIMLPSMLPSTAFFRPAEFLAGPTNEYNGKELGRLIRALYAGTEDIREKVAQPLTEQIQAEKDEILTRFRNAEPISWDNYHPWSWRLAWQEIDSGKDLRRVSIENSNFFQWMLNLSPFTGPFVGNQEMLKAVLLYDFDLGLRILHPITTEDWILKMFFDFDNINWDKIPSFHKELLQRMGISLPIASYRELLGLRTVFKSDPLGIFTSSFKSIIDLFLPK